MGVFENTAESQCARFAADALKASNTPRVIRALLRLYTVLTHFMTLFAIRALIRIKSQEEGGYAIEK